jgi:hypothetical protein
MKDQKYFIIGLCFVLITAAVILVSMRGNSNIEIEVSETGSEWSLAASFPAKYAADVHDYIKSELRMTDLTDFRHLEIKRYETPDHKMRFHIKARTGSLEIVMNRKENSPAAWQRLKKASEGLKSILTRN